MVMFDVKKDEQFEKGKEIVLVNLKRKILVINMYKKSNRFIVFL